MLKKAALVLVLLAACVFVLPADDLDWNSNYKESNVILSLDAGWEDGQIAAYPAAEMILLKPEINDLKFIDLGAKAMVRAGIGFPSFDLGVGAVGTIHFGFKDLADGDTAEYVDPIDIFAEIGVCLDFLSSYDSFIGFVGNSGINYWLEDDFAIGLKYTHWNYFDGGTISVHYKFKDSKKAEKAVEKSLDS